MNRPLALLLGAALVLTFATLSLVVLPGLQVKRLSVSPHLNAYTAEEERGRQVYIANGCIYCHSQQPRSFGQTPADLAKGWGRASTPADYAYDKPHLLGTMRSGPDLLNVGARLPSESWHLTHLYQPRAIASWSNMPSYPYLFKLVDKASPEDTLVKLPKNWQPEGKQVIATQEALDLTAYLISLDRTYPASPEELLLRDQGFDKHLDANQGGSYAE